MIESKIEKKDRCRALVPSVHKLNAGKFDTGQKRVYCHTVDSPVSTLLIGPAALSLTSHALTAWYLKQCCSQQSGI